jgi:2-phosphoglycerate kinase
VEVVYQKLEVVIESYVDQKKSIVIEGVHLSADVMKKLMKRFEEVLSFIVIIRSDSKHRERFAVRSKYMTVDPKQNKYVENFSSIRTIQKGFVKKAGAPLIPIVSNSNLDRSLGLIHATVVKCVRKKSKGVPFFDSKRKQSSSVYEEFNYLSHNIWSSSKAHSMVKKTRVNK